MKDQTFAGWLEQVDCFVWQAVGMSLSDLPDVPTRDWFEDGVAPKSAARCAIRSAMDG